MTATNVIAANKPPLGPGQTLKNLRDGGPTVSDLQALRVPMTNVHAEVEDNLSPLNKAALWITEHVGSMAFFIAIVIWTAVWLGWNFLAPANLQFDAPTGFVFWLFLSNLIQILLMPLIMVGQNVISAHSEARAENDLRVNIKSEQEIELILLKLEHQQRILITMLEKMGGVLPAEEAVDAATV